MLRFGGHPQAIGLTVDSGRLEELRDRLLAAAAEIPGDSLRAVLEYEGLLGAAEVNDGLWQRLRLLQPHGMGNPEPVFRMGPLSAQAVRAFGAGHQEITARGLDGGAVKLLAWQSQGLTLDPSQPFEVLATVERSGWHGGLQMRILAARPPETAT